MSTDKALAGYGTVATFTPDQLYAGEGDTVTTQGTIAAGHALMPRYTVVASVGGLLVPYAHGGSSGTGVPYGILPHDVDASGSSANVDTPVIIGIVANFDVLLAGGATYDQLRTDFKVVGNSDITVQKLY